MGYLIYKATSPSGKLYIGLTSKSLRTRKLQHINSAKKNKTVFYDAINKHGAETIVWEVLESVLSEEEAKLAEIRYISEYKSFDRSFGYNMTEGGDTGNIKTEQSKQKLRDSMKVYFEDPQYLVKMSESRKKSLLENPESGDGLLVGFKNKDHKSNFQKSSEVYRSSSNINDLMAISKKCRYFTCVETGEVFISKSEAAKRLKLCRANIHKALKTGKPYNGYTFKYN